MIRPKYRIFNKLPIIIGRFGFAVFSVGIILGLREVLQPYLGVEAPLLIFLIAIMISAWIGGLWPGVLATFLATVSGIYYFIEPIHSFHIANFSDVVRVILFVIEGLLLSYLIELLLSARRRLEKSLIEEQNAKTSAVEANKAKSHFLATMSHEIRTPMTSILGFTEVLADSDISNPQRLQYLGTIRRNCELLLALIDDLLDFSKIEAKALRIEYSMVEVEGLILETSKTFAAAATKKGLKIEFAIAESVPRSICTDPIRLKQILNNLIGNAIKFSKKGVLSLNVTSSHTLQGKDLISFAVQDRGIGMTEEQASRLFQPFSQGDASISRTFGGSGLGLTISRHLARSMGGDVYLKNSEPGLGSSFVASVLSDPEPQVQENFIAPVKSDSHVEPLKGMHILLADDCADLRELFSTLLTRQGAKVTLVSDGQEAIRVASLLKHDVLLMDIEMPVLDGYSAVTELRKAGYLRPIIALTAHAMAESLQRCMDVGCDDVVTKPLNIGTLVQRIRQVHGRRNLKPLLSDQSLAPDAQ